MSDAFGAKETEIILAYLWTASPQARHWYAAYSNYDGNRQGLSYLINDAQTDRATALMIYWCLGARSAIYARDMTETIEARYTAGFYSEHGIAFDPANSAWHYGESYLAHYGEGVPAIMRAAVEGDIFEAPEDIEPGEALPNSVLEKINMLWRAETFVPGLPEAEWPEKLAGLIQAMIESGDARKAEDVIALGQALPAFRESLPDLIRRAEEQGRTLLAILLREAR